MTIRVKYISEILGEGVFWEGDSSKIPEIRNIVAQRLAIMVETDGKSRQNGMWYVSEVKS